MLEIWKDIKGFTGYQISNNGRVKSLDRIMKWGKTKKLYRGQIITPRAIKHNYLQVPMQKNGKTIRKLIHRLVLETFVRSPKKGEETDHINRIKNDNRLDNLRWVTKMGNMRNVDWSDRTKISYKEVEKIRNNHSATNYELAKIYDVDPSTICKIRRFKRRTIHLQNSISA